MNEIITTLPISTISNLLISLLLGYLIGSIPTGIILGNTETFQIQTSNIYKRQTLSGEFLLVNRFLVEELTKEVALQIIKLE